MLFQLASALRHAGTYFVDLPLRKQAHLWSRVVMSPRVTVRCAERFAASGLPGRCMLEKPLRDYVRRGLGPRRRLLLLEDHYALAAQRCPGLAREFWSGRAVTLGRLAARDVSYRLLIGPSLANRQEGEVSISFEDEADGLVLGRITFLLARVGDRSVVVIGGLQGAPAGSDKARIVLATRRLSGLRPKAALLAAVQAFATACAVDELHAVGRATHFSSSKSRRYQERVHAPYDAFWIERGADAGGPYGYRLPVSPAPAEGGTAQERRRAAHVDAIRAMLAVAVAGRQATLDAA